MNQKRIKALLDAKQYGISKLWIIIVILLFTAILSYILLSSNYFSENQELASDSQANQKLERVLYGISPYQDAVIPQYAKMMGWYKDNDLDVQTKVLAWGDIMPAVGGKAVDVALQNINSFQATYWNIKDRGVDPIFYYIMYVFKGAAIIISKDSPLKTVQELKTEGKSQEEAILIASKQLKGKRIASTEGTEMEQVVLAALAIADLDPKKDAKLIHAQPDEALAAFIGGSVDAFSAGVPEHTEASRHGARILISASDVLPPVLDGIVTTQQYAEEHPDTLKKLVDIWFRTIKYLEEDLQGRTPNLINYLSSIASTKYTVAEYEYVWNNLHFFADSREIIKMKVLSPNGQYYWRRSWDANNDFLIKEKKIPRPVPIEAFWAAHHEK